MTHETEDVDEEDERDLGPEDVAQFLEDFKSKLPKMQDAGKILLDSLFDLLETASQRDLMLKDFDGQISNRETLLSPAAYPTHGRVFITGRDNWAQAFDAPILRGESREGRASISVSNNFFADNNFQYELLEGTGISRVIFYDAGIIEASVGMERRDLTGLEKIELAQHLFAVKTKVARLQ